jgi:hypothetical protein
MPSGILGQSAPAASTNTTVYTVPAGKLAVVNVNIVNRGNVNATVQLALASTGTPTSAEYIEFGVTIPATGVLERTGLVLHAGENIVVNASTADTSVNVYGYED